MHTFPILVEEKKVQLYRDDAVSLSTLYHLRGNMQELLSSKVWLDSGANIIIESLETLTVIDVNSGKNRSRREEALFAINVEAAKEIARAASSAQHFRDDPRGFHQSEKERTAAEADFRYSGGITKRFGSRKFYRYYQTWSGGTDPEKSIQIFA